MCIHVLIIHIIAVNVCLCVYVGIEWLDVHKCDVCSGVLVVVTLTLFWGNTNNCSFVVGKFGYCGCRWIQERPLLMVDQ